MAERTHRASEGKIAVHGFTGAGDAIRGTINSTVDGIFHNKQSEESRVKNDGIAAKGFEDMKRVERRFGEGRSGEHGGVHGGQTGIGPGTGHHGHGVGGGHGSGQGSHFTGH